MTMTSSGNISGFTDRECLQVFWTAFDPLDLASGSIDPVGFLGGYLALADRLLPGLTTVTGVPRYASMICAAAGLAAAKIPASEDLRGARLRQKRLPLLKAYERAWALACGLAAREESVGPVALEGVRGLRYVKRRLGALAPGTKYIRSGSFNLLSNQIRYGGIGIYSAFLDSCHLLTSEDLSLRPTGERLAATFPPPPSDVAVHDEDAPLSIDTLREWGTDAHPGRLTRAEAKYIAEALEGGGESEWNDEVRWSMLKLLTAHGMEDVPPDESETLKEVLESLVLGGTVARSIPQNCAEHIRAVLMVVEPYERLYQSNLFLFQSLQGAVTDQTEVSLVEIGSTASVVRVVPVVAKAARDLIAALERAADVHLVAAQEIGDALRSSGVAALAKQLAAADKAETALHIILERHGAVQAGKFDNGVPKSPWVKRLPNRNLRITAQRHRLEKRHRPGRWSEVGRHPYRTAVAFAFIRACGDRIR
jgi:hypothetical protein